MSAISNAQMSISETKSASRIAHLLSKLAQSFRIGAKEDRETPAKPFPFFGE